MMVEDYNEYVVYKTYALDYFDDNNEGYIYGLESFDPDNSEYDAEWFKTRYEREIEIKKYMAEGIKVI